MLWTIVSVAVVLIPALTMQLYLRSVPSNHIWPNSNFIVIDPDFNDGIAFSALVGKVWVIYLLQSLMIILIFIAWFFIKKWYYVVGLSLILTGSLFNILDRAIAISVPSASGDTENAVLDYFQLKFWFFGLENTCWNFPDLFIIIGAFWTVISFITKSIVDYCKEKKKATKKADK